MERYAADVPADGRNPGNASALVYLPTADPEAISENGQPLDKIEGITVERKGDRTVLHVGSGVYNFSVRK